MCFLSLEFLCITTAIVCIFSCHQVVVRLCSALQNMIQSLYLQHGVMSQGKTFDTVLEDTFIIMILGEKLVQFLRTLLWTRNNFYFINFLPLSPPPSLHLQHLTDEFRLDYCRLWQALIHQNQEEIKYYCTKLHAGHLYRLLACMVTARSWGSIEGGVTRSTRTSTEASHLIKAHFQFVQHVCIQEK